MLAQRTKKLIEEIKPDTVIVQTSPEWWDAARQMKYVESQEEMTQYNTRLQRYLTPGGNESYLWYPGRTWLQMFRLGMYTYLFRQFFRFGDIRFELPGLEVKYACEAAEKVGAQIQYMGSECDVNTNKRLAHETRNTFISYLRNRFVWRSSLYRRECRNNQQKLE